jgi:hypothetical protein
VYAGVMLLDITLPRLLFCLCNALPKLPNVRIANKGKVIIAFGPCKAKKMFGYFSNRWFYARNNLLH